MGRALALLAFLAVCCLRRRASYGTKPGPEECHRVRFPAATSFTSRRLTILGARIEGHPWKYVSVPGYEILTRCDGAKSLYYIRGLLVGNLVEEAMLPRECLLPLTATHTMILYDAKPVAAGSLVPAPPQKLSDDEALFGGTVGTHYSGPTTAEDPDLQSHCVDLWGRDISQSLCAPISFRFRIEHRTPALPLWFIQGVLGPNGLAHHSFRYASLEPNPTGPPDFVVFPPPPSGSPMTKPGPSSRTIIGKSPCCRWRRSSPPGISRHRTPPRFGSPRPRSLFAGASSRKTRTGWVTRPRSGAS